MMKTMLNGVLAHPIKLAMLAAGLFAGALGLLHVLLSPKLFGAITLTLLYGGMLCYLLVSWRQVDARKRAAAGK